MGRYLVWGGVGCLMLGVWGCASDAGSSEDAAAYQPPPSMNPGTGGASSSNGSASSTGGSSTSSSGGSIAIGSGGGANAPSPGAGGTGSVPMPSTGGSSALPGGDASEGEPAAVPGDRYDAPGTNPFTLTSSDPLSTFGADVDTASYDIFRRDVGFGTLPAPESVRLEEYVNNFDYAYPAPAEDSEHPFAIHLSAAPSLYDTGTLLLRVGIQGKQAPAERGPANLVFLVDTSGSMASADKLPIVQLVLGEALAVLRPDDRVAIVTYAGSTEVRLRPTPVTEVNTIRSVIAGLAAAGSTAGGAGLTLAYQQAESAFVEGGINHIVLCTDGDFNVGLSSDQEMLDLITEKRASGVTLTTLGFGSGNLNDSMMEKVSDAGNGMYAVIANADQAVEYANQRLLSTMLHIAKDMKLQVEFNAEKVLAYRLLGYENRAIADDDFRDDAVDAGEVGTGHRVTALYEVVPRGIAIPAPEGAPAIEDGEDYTGPVEVDSDALVSVKVRYKQPGAAEADAAFEVESSLGADGVAASYSEIDDDFRWALAIATFAEILKHSPYARPEQLEGVARLISTSRGSAADRAEFETLLSAVRPLLE